MVISNLIYIYIGVDEDFFPLYLEVSQKSNQNDKPFVNVRRTVADFYRFPLVFQVSRIFRILKKNRLLPLKNVIKVSHNVMFYRISTSIIQWNGSKYCYVTLTI